ncbi:hypothetical protein GCM10010517_44460 [Streptosporangium fragile]|uniref:Uncharacterized protein n=2 Tax=Streptosporangium fragile TaxID=46186 RepID=A0ABN3W134_9ACTN
MVKAMFATRLPAAMDRQIVDGLTVAASGIFRRTLTPPRLNQVPTLGNLRYNRAQASLRRTTADAVSHRRTSLCGHAAASADAAGRGDLLSVLLTAEDPDSTGTLRALSRC